uniref:Si:dkey-92i15.4 n=1 Tax=Cyprinus carpio TaxID=7962 RepID=A0A8C1R712_CYPCA
MDTVDCTPRHRKYTTDYVFGASLDCTDIQQEKPYYNTEKAGTFPRGFSKTYFVPKQEPSTNRENRNDHRDNSSRLSFSVSSKPKWSTEMSSVKKAQSLLPDDNEETSRTCFTGSPKNFSQSLATATAQCNARRNQPNSSSISGQGVKHLLTTSGGIKEEIGEDKHPLDSKGEAHNEIHKEEEKDQVFVVKTEGRRGDGVLEKSRLPSSDSVKNTISMFESLAQQSKSTPKIFRTRRTLSVPEPSKHAALLKKSDSEKNLHFGRVVGNPESLRTNFFSKNDSNEKTAGTVDLSRTPRSNSTVKERPTLEQHQETYKKSLELAPALKQMNEPRTDQVINVRDEAERRTVNKKHMDEPDSTITAHAGLRNIGAVNEKARIPSISQQSNVKSLLKQKSINVKIVDDDENTPTDSPDRAPLTVNIQQQSSPGAVTVNGNHPKALPNHPQSSTHIQTVYSSLNNSNNNNSEITKKDLTQVTTSMARWCSDEEDDDEEIDTEEDSDSEESSVTITSNMSQSERKSFSLSLVELCNYGGVDYKPSDGWLSEDDEDSPYTRSASLSSDISAFSSVTLLSTDELDSLIDDVRGLGDDTLQKYEDVQVVVLHKEVGGGLGFTLAGGVDQNKPVTVHRVIPGGVAAQEGSIFEGAQVLSINGTALQNSAHWDALRTLRKAKGQGMAVVVLQSGNSRKEDTESPGITGEVRMSLNKSSSDLGFSLEGGVGSSSGDKPLTVKKIFRGGPVKEVFPGDELLEVQGQSLVGMMRLEAWSLIKKLPPGPVEVLLHRPQQPS